MKKTLILIAVAASFGLTTQVAIASDIDAGKIFKKKCAMCHKVDKKKVGPALKAMNTDGEALKATITNGRKMMPAFKKKLDSEEIDALVEFIKSNQAES